MSFFYSHKSTNASNRHQVNSDVTWRTPRNSSRDIPIKNPMIYQFSWLNHIFFLGFPMIFQLSYKKSATNPLECSCLLVKPPFFLGFLMGFLPMLSHATSPSEAGIAGAALGHVVALRVGWAGYGFAAQGLAHGRETRPAVPSK